MSSPKLTPSEKISRIERAITSGIEHAQGDATPEERAAAFVAYFSGALKNLHSEEFGDKLFNLLRDARRST